MKDNEDSKRTTIIYSYPTTIYISSHYDLWLFPSYATYMRYTFGWCLGYWTFIHLINMQKIMIEVIKPDKPQF